MDRAGGKGTLRNIRIRHFVKIEREKKPKLIVPLRVPLQALTRAAYLAIRKVPEWLNGRASDRKRAFCGFNSCFNFTRNLWISNPTRA